MIKYAKITDPENHYVEVLFTDDAEYAERNGMTKMDVEEFYGIWYEAGKIPFEIRKNKKLYFLKEEFEDAVKGYFTTSHGYKMQFDTTDSLKMQGAINLMENVTKEDYGYLVQYDDTIVQNVPLSTMKEVLNEMLLEYSKYYLRKQELKQLIYKCTTAEELDSIEITWDV